LPLLDALGQWRREPDAAPFVPLSEQVAPLWLAQAPARWARGQCNDLSLTVEEAESAHMVQELAEVLTVLSMERPVILVLEDLHWSDTATVEALAYLAHRPDLVRVCIVGTYRQADLVVRRHPLRRLLQELFAHELGEELPLELLSEADVAAYVTQRVAGHPLAAELSALIYQRTDGNALFF